MSNNYVNKGILIFMNHNENTDPVYLTKGPVNEKRYKLVFLKQCRRIPSCPPLQSNHNLHKLTESSYTLV